MIGRWQGKSRQGFGQPEFLLLLLWATLLGACSNQQIYTNTLVSSAHLQAGELQSAGIAFLTPSSVTGQEEDRQALALAFTGVLKQVKPSLPMASLSETLGAVNRAGITGEYKQMFEDYRLTGIFDRHTLKKVSDLTGMRYLAELKLGGFRQDSKGRWGAFGLRLLETKTTSIRLYLQIWDSSDGSVAWEGSQEMNFSHDSMAEDSVTFRSIVEQSARDLISRLP